MFGCSILEAAYNEIGFYLIFIFLRIDLYCRSSIYGSACPSPWLFSKVCHFALALLLNRPLLLTCLGA